MGATAAIIATGVGLALSAKGQISAGTAAKNTGYLNAAVIERTSEENARLIEEGSETNAAISEYNSRMVEAKARDAIYRGQETETRFRVDIRGLTGSERASYAAQGVDLASGSALDVQTDTAFQGEMDALTLRVNAAREAWGFQVEAEDYRLQAAATRKLGKLQAKSTRDVGRTSALSARLGGTYAAQAGNYGAASTIAGGAGNILVNTFGYQRNG